jgi:hypothetical protein
MSTALSNCAHLQDGDRGAVIKPPRCSRPSPAFTISDFTIAEQGGTVTCPAGYPVALGRPHADGTRRVQFQARCAGCLAAPPLRDVQYRAGPVRPSQHDPLAAARPRRRQAAVIPRRHCSTPSL